MTRCPRCNGRSSRVIYAGLPMRLCRREACGLLWGFWTWVLSSGLLPFNGAFTTFDGPFLPALGRWLLG